MKLKTIISAITLLGIMSGANAKAMDTQSAEKTTITKRQVVYQCQNGKSLAITYGFNKQKLPTYALASLDGKNRLMPINPTYSDHTGTAFGDENNYNTASETALTLGNYRKTGLTTVQDPSSKILFKDCRVTSSKKVK